VRDRFGQIEWDRELQEDCRQVIRLAVREDLQRGYDWTTVSLVPPDAQGMVAVVARQSGVLSGLPAARLVLQEMDSPAQWTVHVDDGAPVQPGTVVAEIYGPVRDLLTGERLMLNFLGRLSGIATLTQQYVQAVQGTHAEIFDTRKTTPGWRRLERYAVRCGGGRNHRMGLFEAVLIKDNHLAFHSGDVDDERLTPGEAVLAARRFVENSTEHGTHPDMIVQVEVDELDQLDDVLSAAPDIVLLDNMDLAQLREAVGRRDAVAPEVQLEASGNVGLPTIRNIAKTGVERISVGRLTHSPDNLDIALDWLYGSAVAKTQRGDTRPV